MIQSISNLSNHDLKDEDFTHVRLEEMSFRNNNWWHLKLTTCGMVDITLNHCWLDHCEFFLSDFIAMQFIDSRIKDCQFQSHKCLEVTFHRTGFENCFFNTSHFTNTTFIDCKFVDCDFTGSRFDSCDFLGCELDRCKFSNTHWRWPDFTGSTFQGDPPDFASIKMELQRQFKELPDDHTWCGTVSRALRHRHGQGLL